MPAVLEDTPARVPSLAPPPGTAYLAGAVCGRPEPSPLCALLWVDPTPPDCVPSCAVGAGLMVTVRSGLNSGGGAPFFGLRSCPPGELSERDTVAELTAWLGPRVGPFSGVHGSRRPLLVLVRRGIPPTPPSALFSPPPLRALLPSWLLLVDVVPSPSREDPDRLCGLCIVGDDVFRGEEYCRAAPCCARETKDDSILPPRLFCRSGRAGEVVERSEVPNVFSALHALLLDAPLSVGLNATISLMQFLMNGRPSTCATEGR